MVALARAMAGDYPARPAIVISNVPNAGGLARAQELGIPTETVDHQEFDNRADFETELHSRLLAADADFVCLAGFMRVLTEGFVARWSGRMLNIHPSLLPKYPGLNTHARALAGGDKQAGCTVHWVTAGLDSGPIIDQARVEIHPDDTAQTLAARVLTQEHLLYPAALRSALDGLPDQHLP